jgi:NHL repeat-containing protein
MIARWLMRFAPMSLCALVGVLAFGVSPAGAAQTRRELGTFGGASSSVVDPYPLSNPQGVAVDEETEDVYVADAGNHRVEKFSATGQFLLAFGGNVGGPGVDVCGGVVACVPGSEGSAPGELSKPRFVAVDNDPSSLSFHDVYVADTADNVVSKFNAEGALVELWGVSGQLTGFGPILGIAVGANGTLYVWTFNPENGSGGVFEFEPGSESIAGLPEIYGSAIGLGVNPAGDLFSGIEEGVQEVLPTGERVGYPWNGLRGVNEPSALTVASNGDLYFATTAGVLEHDSFNGAGEVLESGGGTCAVTLNGPYCGASDSVQVGFAGSGIAVASGSGDTFLADAGEGAVYRYGPLVTAVPPEVPHSEQAVEVKAMSVKLQGVLNADSEGESGFYEFLYRRSASECEGEGGKVAPRGEAAGKRGEVVASVVGELVPNTTYTFCLRVSNGAGETALGAPVTFTTRVAAPVAGELSVSDVAATSATLNASVNPGGGVTSYVFELAATGGVFTPVGGAGGAGTVAEGTQGVPVSFHTQSLQAGTVYQFRVSATNSAGTRASEPLSFTTEAAGGGLVLPDGRQWEMVSPPNKQGAEILPILEKEVVQAAAGGDAVTYVATAPTESEPLSAPLVSQVLSVRDPDGWVSRDISPPHEQLAPLILGAGEWYVAFSEDLSQAVVQPDGPFEPSLSAEASEQTPYLRTNFLDGNVEDLCEADCYRPLVTAKQGYANVPPGTNINGPGECPPRPQCGPTFRGATPDLSRISLFSETPLLPGGQGSENVEWFDGRLAAEPNPLVRRVSTSEDGSWSYFVSAEALAPGATPGDCNAGGGEGLCNLYVEHGGVTKLVAVLSTEDADDWAGSSEGPADDDRLDRRTSRVSPDGRWFAFMSLRELTGYNTHDAVSGQRDEEVYLYHAPENLADETGTLVCASCNPTGARPVGFEYKTLENIERGLVSGNNGVWREDRWIAANVPGWTPYALGSAIYQSRYLSDGGRLFFNSSDALVPQDVNGNEDVYEYEPAGYENEEGKTECTTGSVLYSPRSNGCVGLISSGQAAGESAFLDASETGGDVFFLTAAKLVPADYDTSLDVYDAHECTGTAPCFPAAAVAPPPCDTGDACKPAPTPQPAIYGSPSSETFSGAGNVTPEAPAATVKAKTKGSTKARNLARALQSCRAKRGTRRRVCERQARTRFARTASATKRGGR